MSDDKKFETGAFLGSPSAIGIAGEIEFTMAAAERAAFANGYEARQSEIDALTRELHNMFAGYQFSAMSDREFLEFLRDRMIRTKASHFCIRKLDDILDRRRDKMYY